jgi:hypothetical protein
VADTSTGYNNAGQSRKQQRMQQANGRQEDARTQNQSSCTFAAETTGEGEVLWLDGDTLGVDSGKVGVLEQ